jgi:2-isopropylmalate synthase
MKTIQIFDTTLRDGEQAPGYAMNLDEKVRMALQLEALGVDVMEAGFAIASPGDFASVKAVAEAVKTSVVCSLARALEKDIQAAAKSVAGAARGRIHTFLATSDLHLRYKLKMSRSDCLRQIRKAVTCARNLCGEVEFSAEDASRTDLDFLCKAFETAIAAGARIVNVPDTVGYATPGEFGALVGALMNRVKGIENAIVSTHCHDDLGLAVANSLAGVRAGARQVECTVCGIGERAGNAALEELMVGMKILYGLDNDYDLSKLPAVCAETAQIAKVQFAANKPVAGVRNYTRESGIGVDLVIKEPLAMFATNPSIFGRVGDIALGKKSGKASVEYFLEKEGIEATDEQIRNMVTMVKEMGTAEKRLLTMDEFHKIVEACK